MHIEKHFTKAEKHLRHIEKHSSMCQSELLINPSIVRQRRTMPFRTIDNREADKWVSR